MTRTILIKKKIQLGLYFREIVLSMSIMLSWKKRYIPNVQKISTRPDFDLELKKFGTYFISKEPIHSIARVLTQDLPDSRRTSYSETIEAVSITMIYRYQCTSLILNALGEIPFIWFLQKASVNIFFLCPEDITIKLVK